MSTFERRFGAGMLQNDPNDPGLVQDIQGFVYLVKPDGSRCLLDCGGTGGNTPDPTGAGDILYSADGLTWTILPIGAQDEVLTVDTGLPVWEPGGTSVVAGDALQFTGNVLDVLFDGVTIDINGSNQLEVIGGAVTPTGPAGGDLAGTYPNPTLAVIGSATGPIGDATHTPVVTIDAKGRVTALTSAAITGVPPSGAAGGDLVGTYPNPTLALIGSATGPIGDATHSSQVTIDAKGRVTALASVAITGTAPGGAAGGDLAGTYPNPTLAVIGSATGPLGDATHAPVVTIDAKGRVTALTSVLITGTVPGGAAGGDLAGTYPNPTLAVIGSATGPIGDGTHVSTVTIDAKGRVTALTSTAITPDVSAAVILAPGTTARNTITPTADIIPLTITGRASQTAQLFRFGSDSENPWFRATPGSAAGVGDALALGAGTFDPNFYGGFLTKFTVANASDGVYQANGAPSIVPGSNAVRQVALDLAITPVTDNPSVNHRGLGGSIRFSGGKQYGSITGIDYEAILRTAGTPGTLQGQETIGGILRASTASGSTGDVLNITGVWAEGFIDGSNIVQTGGIVAGVLAIAGTYAASGTTVPEAAAVLASIHSSGKTITVGQGVKVKAPTSPSSFGTIYGLRILTQTGATTKSYGILSEGGFNELRAGAATEIPLTVHGFTAQSANLFVTEDVSGNDLVAISSAGVILFGSSADTNLYRSTTDTLKTDDNLIVALGFSQLGTTLGFLNATPVVQQAASTLSGLWTALKNYGLLTSGSAVPVLSGTELDYVQITTSVTVSATVENSSATLVIASSAVVYDGTPVILQFYTPRVQTGAGTFVIVTLYEGATRISSEFAAYSASGGGAGITPGAQFYRFTPSAGSHTYSVLAYRGSANGIVTAGNAGANQVPAFLRITKA